MILPPSLVALQHRNFRLLWSGQFISRCGTMLQTAGLLWHVSLLVPPDQKGLALGLVGLVRIVPVIIFSLVSGVAADALDRRRMLLMTQWAMALTAGLLAVFTFSGLSSVWPIYVLAALSAAAGAFDSPARSSLITNLVPRAHLPNAISLTIIVGQLASVIGPALAGLVIANLGVGWIYVLDAASFLAVIAALLLMRDVPHRPAAEMGALNLQAALEGLRFVFREPLIRSTTLLDFVANFFSSAYALLPIFAQDILAVGAQGYGWLYAAPSLGALVASAAMVRAIDRVNRRGWLMLGAIGAFGLATVIFGLSRSFWLTFACLAVTGAADTVNMVLRHVIRQLGTPDHLRGRMTSVTMIFFTGGPELGEMEAGLVAHFFGAAFSVVSGGVACLLATGLVAWHTPELRRYRRQPAALVASGVATD
jgi:MFS family permease